MFRCNGCGELRPTSREHLIHQAVGGVLFRDPTIKTADLRRRLRDDPFLSGFLRHEAGEDPEGVLFDDYIVDLLCASCNNKWANVLEQQAGTNLYSFVHEGGAAKARLLRRWVWFFAMKLWWYQEKTVALQTGPLHPVLSRISNPDTEVLMYTRVGRLDASPDNWRFGWTRATVPPRMRYEFWFWGLAFFAVAQDGGNPDLPFETRELTEGLTANDLPLIRLADLAKLPEVNLAL